MTPRQALKALVAPYRYRVVRDADGWPMIPGKLGRLELARRARTGCLHRPAPNVRSALGGPRSAPLAVGDQEVRGLVAVDALPAAARLFQARRRRTLSPETARQKGARTAYRGTSAD